MDETVAASTFFVTISDLGLSHSDVEPVQASSFPAVPD